MGRRSFEHQQTLPLSHRPGKMAVVVSEDPSQVVTPPYAANASDPNLDTMPMGRISKPASNADESATRFVTAKLEARELTIAKREADLLARRREAAREIRRQHRESLKIETRLAGIESLVMELNQGLRQITRVTPFGPASEETIDEDVEIEAELQAEIQSLHDEIEALTMQNEQLAGDLAQSSIRRSISNTSDANPTMSWEQRKAMIFARDEVSSAAHGDNEFDDVAELKMNMDRLRRDVQARDFELAQLRDLLEQRPTACEEGTAIGAAAIAQMMDSDELVREERQRLQELQTEWESKFRKMEIAASIERANLARERQQLERQNAGLEEQLAHLKRELKQEEITGPNQKRRWFAKLGLAD